MFTLKQATKIMRILLLTALLYSVITQCACARGKVRKLMELRYNRRKFEEINFDGFYAFQFVKLCFCFPCFTAPMDVIVENNLVSSASFAEGNNFALDRYCANIKKFHEYSLEDAELTINDLFDIIEKGILQDYHEVDVVYHSDGFPISIALDIDPKIADDEWFYYIYCVQFPDNTNTARDATHYIRRERFNYDDNYSCNNIQQPQSCPQPSSGLGSNDLAFECDYFYDGCNNCVCDGSDVISCTKRYCPEDEYGDQKCLNCESNTEWSDCSGVCNPICEEDFGDLLCGIRFIQEPGCGEPRCQCPTNLPYWDGYECISEKECDIQQPVETPAPVSIVGGTCPEMCDAFDDGCEACLCDDDGNSFQCESSGAIGACIPGFRGRARCTECQDPDTMEYTTTASCTTTCQQLIDHEFSLCPPIPISKCACKVDTPYYLESEGKCVTAEECQEVLEPAPVPTPCVEMCVEYYDGCGVTCSCPGGDTGTFMCFAVTPCSEFLDSQILPNCNQCEDDETMEYVTNGSFCTATCDNPNPVCGTGKERCQCKPDTPIYSHDEGKCIKEDECWDILTPPVMPCNEFLPCPVGIECNDNGICEIPILIPITAETDEVEDEGDEELPGAIPPGF